MLTSIAQILIEMASVKDYTSPHLSTKHHIAASFKPRDHKRGWSGDLLGVPKSMHRKKAKPSCSNNLSNIEVATARS